MARRKGSHSVLRGRIPSRAAKSKRGAGARGANLRIQNASLPEHSLKAWPRTWQIMDAPVKFPGRPDSDQVAVDSRRMPVHSSLRQLTKGYWIMATGTVKWFNNNKGYGFIRPDDGSDDAFVHISALERAGLTTLTDGQKISYELRPGRGGKSSAEDLSLVE